MRGLLEVLSQLFQFHLSLRSISKLSSDASLVSDSETSAMGQLSKHFFGGGGGRGGRGWAHI